MRTSSHMLHSLAEPSVPTETAFALDGKPDGGEIEDLSCISSHAGLGTYCNEVIDGERDKAEETYYQYKRARKKSLTKKHAHTPRKGKGKGRKGAKRG